MLIGLERTASDIAPGAMAEAKAADAGYRRGRAPVAQWIERLPSKSPSGFRCGMTCTHRLSNRNGPIERVSFGTQTVGRVVRPCGRDPYGGGS
jgi:hypothetical protein